MIIVTITETPEGYPDKYQVYQIDPVTGEQQDVSGHFQMFPITAHNQDGQVVSGVIFGRTDREWTKPVQQEQSNG
jgi:hypothetical protein